MSNYWKKKLDELEEEKKNSSKTSNSSDYWERKKAELDEEQSLRASDYDEDIAPVKTTEARDANFIDVTWNSLKRGYYNALYGEESYKAMFGQSNAKDEYAAILAGDDYNFEADNWFEKAISGASELLGQQARQWTNPTSLAVAGAAMTGVALAGQAGPQVAIPEEILTVPAAGLIGLQAGSVKANYEIEAGLAYNEMLDAGISEDTARKVAMAVGTGNAALEAIQADELLKAFKVTSKGATKSLSKKILDELARRGIDVVSETAQEVAQEGVTIAGTQLASKAETGEWAYSADEVKDRLGDTAVSSLLSFGVLNAPATSRNVVSITNEHKAANAFTENEQKVVDKVYEDTIAKKEADGTKLTQSEKNKLYDEIKTKVDEGGISIDTIAEVLGGDTYNSYKEIVDSEDATIKELDDLYGDEAVKNEFSRRLAEAQADGTTLTNKEKSKMYKAVVTEMQSEHYNAVKDIYTNSKRSEVGGKLYSEVFEAVKGDKRLVESFNERARATQKYQADLTKYTDENAKKTIQNIMDAGVANNTKRFRNFADMLAKISADKGIVFSVTDAKRLANTVYAVDGKTVNGFITEDGITINLSSRRALEKVAGHEVTHALEGTEFYSEFVKIAEEYAKTKGEYDSRYRNALKTYRGVKGYEGAQGYAKIKNEVIADLVGDYIFNDTEFVKHLSVNNKDAFTRIWDEIKYLAKIVTAGTEEARQIARAEKAFKDAFDELYRSGEAKSKGGTKYSLYMSEKDIPEYLKAGNRQNKNRQERYESGQQMIISTDEEFNSFVQKSIDGASNNMVAYGKVDENLATQVFEKSDDTIDIADAYLELLSNDVRHAYREHSKAKESGDMDMSVDDLIYALKNVNQSEVVSARRYNDGAQRVTLAVPTDDGTVMLVELASKSAGTLRLKTGWKVTDEKFAQKYRSGTSSAEGISPTNTARDATASDNIVPQNEQDVNTLFSLSSENGEIKDVSTGYAYGESYYTMSFEQDGKVVGTLEYGEYDGKPNVKMVEVEPEYRRKGIATKLLQELQKKYPDAEIDFGMTTPDGTKLLDSITYDVTDEAVVADRQRLKDLQTELNDLQGKLDGLYELVDNGENLTEAQETELHALGDRWNEAYDSIRELEKSLRGKSATKTFVKTDSDVRFSLSNPQTEKDYMSAVKNGDTETASKIVEQVAREAGYTVKVYHGTQSFGFTVLDPAMSDDEFSFFATGDLLVARSYSGVNGTRGISEKAVYDRSKFDGEQTAEKTRELVQQMTDALGVDMSRYADRIKRLCEDVTEAYELNRISELKARKKAEKGLDSIISEAYGKDFKSWKKTEEAEDIYFYFDESVLNEYLLLVSDSGVEGLGNYAFYANTDGLLVIDCKGSNWDDISSDVLPKGKWTTRKASEYAKNAGYKGVWFKNVVDNGGRYQGNVEAADIFNFFNPQEQVKSADPVTYDKKGRVIPLSERFNASNPDIRFSLSEDSDGKKLTKEQSDFFKDSKMRDDNGNLMVMYHGSQDAGFHIFDPSMSDDDSSLFFVNRNDVAASYSGTSETYEAQTIHTAEDMNNFIESIGVEGYEVVEKDGKFTLLYEGERVADSNTAKGIYDEFCWYEGVGDGDANYKVYLNLKNPLEVDAKGRNWNNISREYSQEVADRYNSLTAEEKAALTDLAGWEDFQAFRDEILSVLEQKAIAPVGEDYKHLDSAIEKLGGNNINISNLFSIASDDFSAESINQFAVKQMNTRDYAKKAKAEGYDGVIFKNIHDNGGYSNGSEGASTVAIAFESNQIKSVANEKPTSDKDIRYSLSDPQTDKDYRAAVERGDIEVAQKIVDDVAKDAGYTVRAYHGTRRGDRVGNVFLPERATSGPMAFFTDNKEIAENYAKSKQDTSMAYDPDFDRYETQFRIKTKHGDIPLYKAWGYLPFDARNRITKNAGQLHENWDGDYELILDPNTNEANGGFQWQLKEARGNAIQALTEQWLNSGTLFNEESRFLDVLEMAGVTEEFKRIGMDSLYFKDPNARHEKVYNTFLKITKPFDTANTDEQFIAGLEKWYDAQDQSQYARETADSDLWDKHNIDAYVFAERLRDDLEKGTSHAWTSIPDAVTDYLKSLGYDGIKDIGGKNGGAGHTVWIPFYSEQVKSAEAVTYDDNGNVIPLSDRFNPDKTDIRYSLSDEGENTQKRDPLLTYGEDVLLEQDVAPVQGGVQGGVQDAAPVAEQTAENIAPMPDSVPMTEDEANAMRSENFASIDDVDAPEETEAPFDAPRDSVTIDGEALERLTQEVNNLLFLDAEDSARMAQTIQNYAQDSEMTEVDLFNEIFEDYEYYDEVWSDDDSVERAKAWMRGTKLYIPEDLKADFNGKRKDGFNAFRREHFGHFYLTTDARKNALPVDSLYQELSDQFPNLFPEDITNVANQLMQMGDVASMSVEPEYRHGKYDAETIQEAVDAIRRGVSQYSQNETLKGISAERDMMSQMYGESDAPMDDIAPVGVSAPAADVAPEQDVAPSVQEGVKASELVSHEDFKSRENEIYKKVAGLSAGKYHKVDGYGFHIARGGDGHATITIKTPDGQKLQRRIEGGKYWKNTRLWHEAARMVASVEMPNVEQITPEEAKKAKIITDDQKPKQTKKPSRWVHKTRTLVGDKQSSIEDVSLKHKNRTLMAKADAMHRSESSAQRFIGKGADGVRALADVRSEVKKSGLNAEFQEYMYDMLNTDRMSLEENAKATFERLNGKFDGLRDEQIYAIAAKEITDKTTARTAQTIRDAREYLSARDARNLPVYGADYTAEMSRESAAKAEAEHPEFKQWAQDIYDICNWLRAKLVADGEISQETADLWAKIYPHYVPIHRVDKDGNAVYVPLDTNRTGVNAPIKRATGGDSTIGDLFETIAKRAEQTFKAGDRNSFGLELMNTLGTRLDQQSQSTSLNATIDEIEYQEERLKKGENGSNPTFTVFENGKRVEFEITEELYDALKPTNEILASEFKPAAIATKIQRGLLTQYNLMFTVTNAIKDAQAILVNSQHPTTTYMSIPEAVRDLSAYAITGNESQSLREYFEHGGEGLTYFDRNKDSFKDDSVVKKVLGFIPDKISDANDFIERIPRLAEYIASRKAGRSIEVSMLDAARVTTNFSAGGDLAKFANRNGFTFLNASIQGFNQQVRNVREAKANGFKGVMQLAAKYAVAGLPVLLFNSLMWDDDEEYEELSDYVKDNYYIVAKYGDGQFVRIPKGREVAVIQNAFEQMKNLITGDDDVDMARFGELLVENIAPNNPLDNNVIAPIKQVLTNKTWYGDDLVPTRLQDVPAAEQYDETTSSIAKWLGEHTNTSPYKWNYVLDQYSGGIGDVFLPMMTPKAESGNSTFAGKMLAPMKDKFTTDSVLKNQNVSDFYDTVDELTKNANSAYATDEDVLKSKYMSSVNADLGELYQRKREIQNSDMSDKEKYNAVRDIQKQIDDIAKKSLDTYGDVYIDGDYARVGDRHYQLNDKGEWQKVNDKQLEKQNNVTRKLGISESEYWSNKEEYVFAYENPEKYTVAKAVGGYEAYKGYQSELYDIKADKDASGKSISGSRKEKVIDYVNGLDIDYGERLILFKSEYNADDTYNYEIIHYLNNRDDISYDEMVTILKELGFTVDSRGNIYWD